tara:strand:- start:901 stop:1209 length:309 start_codon:yes stop_codon:yes gene_type:complete
MKDNKMKDNKLIAEFMGLEFDNGLYCYTTAMDDYKTDTLYFDSSWDWLMPVVSKIGNIKNYGINGTLDWLSESEFNIEQERDGLYTIEDVFLSVVEFVKRTT